MSGKGVDEGSPGSFDFSRPVRVRRWEGRGNGRDRVSSLGLPMDLSVHRHVSTSHKRLGRIVRHRRRSDSPPPNRPGVSPQQLRNKPGPQTLPSPPGKHGGRPDLRSLEHNRCTGSGNPTPSRRDVNRKCVERTYRYRD